MKNQHINTLAILSIAGAATASIAGTNVEPTKLDATAAKLRHVDHIYYNIATGEKITTLINAGDAQAGVDGQAGNEIWIAATSAQCSVVDPTDTTTFFFGIDDPTGTTSLSLNAFFADWGDIAFDTVVDCVQINWITNHADTDSDNDGNADGVDGFGGTWTYWDAYNGRSPGLECISAPLIQFSFFDLPGEFPADTATVAFYTADIDLAGSFGSSLTFELGDTDSDLQGAAVHNAMINMQDLDSDSISDADPDEDGLADWAWSLQFIQPGTVDVDNADSDSDTQTGIDGDIADLNTAGIVFGSPTPGFAEFDTIAQEWNWIPDGPTAGATEDLFNLGTTSNPDGSGFLTIAGAFFFGGFDCSLGTPGYTPPAHFQVVLYGPDNIPDFDCGDLAGNIDGTPDGLLNFSDISAFLSWFAAGDLRVDFAGNPDGSPDGLLNFFDVTAYLAIFSAGCP
ncbi:MAG: GC-type dockerin domain-anchored protein [Phycisphaerales bacterium]